MLNPSLIFLKFEEIYRLANYWAVANNCTGYPMLDLIKSEILEVKTAQTEMTKSVQFCSDKIDQFENDMKEVKSAFTSINSMKTEITSLKGIIAIQQTRISELEQRSRIDNIEIQGVTELNGENIYNTLQSIGQAIQCQISSSDISVAHRVQHVNNDNSNPRNIIVKFLSRQKKDEFLAASKRIKRTTTNSGGPGLKVGNLGNSIFINDHLSKENKILLKRTKDTAKEKNYKFVWVRNCIICIRKNESSPAKTIKSEIDLIKM